MKTENDICMLCGCERKYHEEGLGHCESCNPGASRQWGCSGFREVGNERIIKEYKKRIRESK